MRNEKNFFYHCNEFIYSRFFEIFSDTLGYDVLDSNVYLYEKD